MAQIFIDPDRENNDGIVHFGSYRPWSWHKMFGGNGSNYPEYSGRILDLKQSRPGAVEYFRARVEPALGDGFAIAVVPSHDPANTNSGLRQLAVELAKSGTRIDATGCLVRTVKINKLSQGGDRSIAVHLRSIVVNKPGLIRGLDVLLLDDVTTSGHSLLACRKLLLDAAASRVRCAALGHTE